ncbi:3740_t:CDS:2, partial [Scutellospora calospora]
PTRTTTKRSFIPRKLDDVIDVERDIMKVAQAQSNDNIRIESENQATIVLKEITREMNDQKESENEDQDDLEDIESGDDKATIKMSIKERKKIAKEEAREK